MKLVKNLPKLVPTKIIKKERYSNQTVSGQNKLPSSTERAYLRSKTYQGIAEAMAQQWAGSKLTQITFSSNELQV